MNTLHPEPTGAEIKQRFEETREFIFNDLARVRLHSTPGSWFHFCDVREELRELGPDIEYCSSCEEKLNDALGRAAFDTWIKANPVRDEMTRCVQWKNLYGQTKEVWRLVAEGVIVKDQARAKEGSIDTQFSKDFPPTIEIKGHPLPGSVIPSPIVEITCLPTAHHFVPLESLPDGKHSFFCDKCCETRIR